MFRVYADKDNNPADYSKDNVPYVPKQHLKISLKGIDTGRMLCSCATPAFPLTVGFLKQRAMPLPLGSMKPPLPNTKAPCPHFPTSGRRWSSRSQP